MLRTTTQAAPRLLRAAAHNARIPATRRFASTGPAAPVTKGTWKGFFVRLGLAGGAVYYYNTSPLFAHEPELIHVGLDASTETALPTLESIASSRAQKSASQASNKASSPPATPPHSNATPTEAAVAATGSPPLSSETPSISDPAALQAEAGQQGAFNPETGEINWDCPCLGGMAHGPCGEQFRAAFSCFIYSEEEPKGMDCIDKFKGMQDCFREHPDVYGAELEDDDDEPLDSSGAEAAAKEATSKQSKKDSAAGKAADNLVEKTEQATSKVEEKAAAAGAAAKNAAQKAQSKAAEGVEKAKAKAIEVKEKGAEVREQAKTKAAEAKEKAQ